MKPAQHNSETLNAWLDEHPERGNDWLPLRGLQVYVRRTNRKLSKRPRTLTPTLDLASIQADKPGRGDFTDFLTSVERIAEIRQLAVYVENILSERFVDFFLRRGYKLAPDAADWLPSVFLPWKRKRKK